MHEQRLGGEAERERAQQERAVAREVRPPPSPTTLPSPSAARTATKPTVSSAGVITEVLAPDSAVPVGVRKAGAIARIPMMPTIEHAKVRGSPG